MAPPCCSARLTTRSRAEAYELLEAGVEHVFRDKLDSSLRLGVEALRLLGFRAHHAHRAAQTFRRHDERALRELAAQELEELEPKLPAAEKELMVALLPPDPDAQRGAIVEIRAGAAAVQLYTAMVYDGLSLAARIPRRYRPPDHAL